MTLLKNFVLFVFHFFSISLLLRTWFQKFSRLGEEYKKGFDIESFFSTLIINTLMRIIGFLVRSVLILVGLFCAVFVGVLGFLLLIGWLLFPLLVVVSFISGFAFIV